MYADGVLLNVSLDNIGTCEILLIRAVESLSAWLKTIGLSISMLRFKLCIFTRSRVRSEDISLNLAGALVSCQPSPKYLGIIWDRPLSCVPHIKPVAAKNSRAINVMRVIFRITWGASPSGLLTVHRGLLRVSSPVPQR